MDRKNIYIVIFIITTIIASCTAIYFAVNQTTAVEGNKEQNISVNEEKEEQTKVETVEKIVYKYQLPKIDESKCINVKEQTYNVKRNSISIFQTCQATVENKKEVSLRINGDIVKKMHNLDISVDKFGYLERVINNFEGSVVDVKVFNVGQGVGNEVIFFLMEDGTVEYMELIKAMQKDEYKSQGKIKGVEGVVEINLAYGSRNFHSPIGVKEDGSFYDLWLMIATW